MAGRHYPQKLLFLAADSTDRRALGSDLNEIEPNINLRTWVYARAYRVH